jgi:hypothetical protein
MAAPGPQQPAQNNNPNQAPPHANLPPGQGIHTHPWKFKGYRVFSKWMASDQAFFVVRRFGALNCRVILSMQDELVQLEEELETQDQLSMRKPAPNIHNGSFRLDNSNERRKLITETIPQKLKEYSKCLAKLLMATWHKRLMNTIDSFINEYSGLVNREPINPGNVGLVSQWFTDVADKAVYKPEQAFIDCHDDLIPVQPKTRSQMRKALEKTLLLDQLPLLPMRRWFQREPREYEVIRDDQTVWPNDKRVENLCSTVLATIGLAMLVGPLWILEYVNKTPVRLGIITGFVALFFALVAVGTTARAFESLAAAAAYSAVLVVFLQFGTNNR